MSGATASKYTIAPRWQNLGVHNWLASHAVSVDHASVRPICSFVLWLRGRNCSFDVMSTSFVTLSKSVRKSAVTRGPTCLDSDGTIHDFMYGFGVRVASRTEQVRAGRMATPNFGPYLRVLSNCQTY
jgi:hypothetical protein